MTKAATHIVSWRSIAFIATLLFSFCGTYAQTVSGVVYLDSEGKNTAEFAVVIIEDIQRTATTNAQGEFKFSNVPPGEYKINAFQLGYQIRQTLITVGNKDELIDFYLVQDVEQLEEVVVSYNQKEEKTILNDVEGTAIYAGKKTEVIQLDNITASKSTNNVRQLFAKISGLNIWESDGAGLQLGIAARGLNPNRTSSFNTRLNGYDLSADAIGYPESYYTPPSESLEEIQVVRGAASLQYGTQFGGMLNFVTKKGAKDKKAEFNLRQTYGSYGFINSYNSVGGTVGKFNYYGYLQHKQGNGWRENGDFDYNSGFFSFQYTFNPRFSINADITSMKYLAHQPGGLTDNEFDENPRQSNRERNWFEVVWNLGAVTLDYHLTERTKINSKTYALAASRNAVGNLSAINRIDGNGPRNLLKDNYRNIGNETRLIHRYALGKQSSNFLVGVRTYRGHLYRDQGFGTDQADADFDYYNRENTDNSSYLFPSTNIAAFAENVFRINNRFTITPGMRYEYISTQSEGEYTFIKNDLAGNVIEKLELQAPDKKLARRFPLFGIGLSYFVDSTIETYGNISQNYRAITFGDMVVTNPSLEVDPLIQDENGFNADLGIRGKINHFIRFDATLFYLSYNDRIGLVQKINDDFQIKRLRTNIADSRTYGIESFIELDFIKLFQPKNDSLSLSIFSNISVLNSRYIDSEESAFQDKKVELVPDSIIKLGMNFRRKNFSASFNYSYTSSQYTDATNATFTSNAVNGLIPSFWVMDASMQYQYKLATLELSCNNLTNKMYFTRRADGYPGPGIIPSDGRAFYLTLDLTF